ncbi:MAG: aconitate hydratase AcnA [Opitutales bacterium]
MSSLPDPLKTLRPFESSAGHQGHLYSLPALEDAGVGPVSRLPFSIRVVLEAVLRHCDGQTITEDAVKQLANWNAAKPSTDEIPFVVARIVLQDFTGVPLLVDLAAMRDAVAKLDRDPKIIEPLVPVDLVVDHSVQVDRAGTPESFTANLQIEFERNRERYEFLKWGQQSFETFSVVPPAIGIVHQVNLEYLARVVFENTVGDETVFYPDSLVGTDSHTTMINGLGVVGWGVGGIEAEAGMLGQPVYFQTPEVIGVHLTGQLAEGVTATDLTLRITQMLREEKVVGKFVEFFGEGAASLSLPDRATIGNMAPEYGATMGYFPVDEKSLEYLALTGRSEKQLTLIREYLKAQGLFGIPRAGDCDYTKVIELDMGSVMPAVAGPKRPQDRIDVPHLKGEFLKLLSVSPAEGGFGKSEEALRETVAVQEAVAASTPSVTGGDLSNGQSTERSANEMVANRPATPGALATGRRHNEVLRHGSVLIAAITSCTNTSNPSVMIAAGLVAKKATERGLKVDTTVKASLAPGSRVVTDYLNETGLQTYLDQIGFNLVGYGCTTCIGNSGPLDETIEAAIKKGDLVCASVLSGNRNFEARVHSSIKANFLMSPPLVVAYALAGRVDIDLQSDPIGQDDNGQDVFLRDIWPTQSEINELVRSGLKPEMFIQKYSDIDEANPEWKAIGVEGGTTYAWNPKSTYIQQPPFFDGFTPKVKGAPDLNTPMRALAILGDSVTTDHISPAGAIPKDGPAGRYLIENDVEPPAFNSFGSRRGNDRVMTRGTFANVRIKNLMADGKEGGWTKVHPSGELKPIHDACAHYASEGTPLIVFGGSDYGMGSSRDWAAKGTALLGVRAVVVRSFERIHRSNLIGMGVLPLQFAEGQDAVSLGLDGSETFRLEGLGDSIEPRSKASLVIEKNGEETTVELTVRIDTAIESEYYRHGGILPYVLRNLLS